MLADRWLAHTFAQRAGSVMTMPQPVSRRRSLAVVFVLTAVAAAASVLLLWPEHPRQREVVPAPSVLAIAAPAPTALDAVRFASFLGDLRAEALAAGLLPSTIDLAFVDLAPDPEVLDLANAQPEYVKTAGEYLGLLVSEARIENGRLKLREHEPVLAAVEKTYGVNRYIVLAIWGVESNYGVGMGNRRIMRSLATLAAYDTRRPQFWRSELLAALRILPSGDTTSDTMVGSWAGAMGHTQFMPTTYAVHAVDFDKDGRRDIWHSIPDALASTANYLKASGWMAGQPWGFEVKVPDRFDYALSAPGVSKNWSEWQKLGLSRLDTRALPTNIGPLQLLLPAGARGPAFLVGANFKAILRYNNAVSYALAVGHLADRLAGQPPLVKPWPADDKALGKGERDDLQRRLTALGFDAGTVDGVIGTSTRAAVRAFQKSRGLPEDGHPDLALLDRLRQEGTP